MARILSKREKGILYCTIGVAVFAAVFNFILLPVINKNSAINRETEVTKTKLKKYLWLLGQKDNIQNKYRKFTSSLGLTAAQEDSLVGVLAKIESLAKQANIRTIDIRPQAPKTADLYKELLVDLRAEGAMDGFARFIYDIENSLSLLRIKKFQFTSKSLSQNLEGNFVISQVSVPK